MHAELTKSQEQLQSWVTETARRLEVPGVAVGVYHRGEEQYAFYGITSIENPLPVDEGTLFQYGSISKTFTATAIMRLVEQGRVDLDEKVHTYVPELTLKDADVAHGVTVLHLLNHTAGWEGDLWTNTGDGDDALAKYVENMADIEQVTPLGAAVDYNNTSVALAGRIIEKVTGTTFEQAIRDMLFEPLGLEHCFFFPNDIMTRRFALGHNQDPTDGTINVTRPWALPRGFNPAGGMSSNASDQIAWARFHQGDGRAKDGRRVLSAELLKRMQDPTAEAPGGALGDAVGIGWLLRDVDGVRLVSHDGDTTGQHATLVMVPDRDFAISSLTNCGPNGQEFNQELLRWAFEAFAGVVERDPEPVLLSESVLAQYTGRYEAKAHLADVVLEGGGLLVKGEFKPDALKEIVQEGQDVPPQIAPLPIGLLSGPGDRYVVTEGPGKGNRGYFLRSASGSIEAIHVFGRLLRGPDSGIDGGAEHA